MITAEKLSVDAAFCNFASSRSHLFKFLLSSKPIPPKIDLLLMPRRVLHSNLVAGVSVVGVWHLTDLRFTRVEKLTAIAKQRFSSHHQVTIK